ncbi:MAG TPA: hypothetical protein VJ809_05660 [Pirellulales bacterium]|jgi:hypothetical protein|nr:hypothetical protein [Pirellulales bacterium]
MQASFDQFGIRFQYPDNWTLEADDLLRGQGSVSVYSPGGGFWSLTVHEPNDDPDDLVEAVVDAMRNMYDELDAEETVETIDGRKVSGCEMNFYCLDLTNTATVRVLQSPRANYLVLYQAEDREFAELEAVFEAMTASLVKQSSWLRESA